MQREVEEKKTDEREKRAEGKVENSKSRNVMRGKNKKKQKGGWGEGGS